ncbi:ATP-binding protein [Streptomyces sp. NPDC044571]|uniref:AAA family ATPase n=1 Tax=Streptomyces sp. NPDC044571 TaxID=3155371 RepID=UPI0033D15D2C
MNAADPQRTPVREPEGTPRPRRLFDRDDEWAALTAFAQDPKTGPGLCVVSGRPRQGKTLLLEALARATGGFYFSGQEATEADSLRRLGEEYARYRRAAAPSRWPDWKHAVDELLALGDTRPLPVVIDAFPDLVEASPALPSVIHGALRRLAGSATQNRTRLVLGGETAPVMSRLFAGSPLRSIAELELRIQPLDFRAVARLWGIEDPALALRVHAVVGGTPAYRYDYVNDDVPRGPEDFDGWICRTVLNPRTPLFREARHLVDEETGHGSHGACHSVLAALASGCTTHGEIAAYAGQQLPDASRALTLLRDHGMLLSQPDGFRPGLVRHRIADPLLAFEHAVVRPRRTALESEEAAAVWQSARADFSRIAEECFAQICRYWAEHFAAPATFGAARTTAAYGSLPSDPDSPEAHAAEVVVRGHDGRGPERLLSIGLARLRVGMDIEHLRRLHRLVDAAAAAGEDTGRVRPALYGGSGFSPELRAAQTRGDVMLVDLDRLYHGH